MGDLVMLEDHGGGRRSAGGAGRDRFGTGVDQPGGSVDDGSDRFPPAIHPARIDSGTAAAAIIMLG